MSSNQDYRSKYINFRADLREAVRAGQIAEQNEPDTGACNFDAPTVYLPFWKAAEINIAAEMAGIHAHEWRRNGVKAWIFSPKTTGQANRRTVNAEAMANELRRRGYTASVYYQID